MRLFKSALLASALALTSGITLTSLAATPPSVQVVAQNIDDIVAMEPAQAY